MFSMFSKIAFAKQIPDDARSGSPSISASSKVFWIKEHITVKQLTDWPGKFI